VVVSILLDVPLIYVPSMYGPHVGGENMGLRVKTKGILFSFSKYSLTYGGGVP
jgi:hypothetical protein